MSPAIVADIPEPMPLGRDMTALDADVIELALLLPRWQAVALQTAAMKRGLSAGQMLRRMIGATIGVQPPLAHA
jgi:hypothetical protein